MKVQSVLDLRPDLVVANREENDRSQVEHLQEILGNDAVLVTDVRSVRAALEGISTLGERIGRSKEADNLVSRIEETWGDPRTHSGSAGYAVWSKPWMVAGGDTYIHDVMNHWGIANAFPQKIPESRYPTLGSQPRDGVLTAQTWLLPSEPFPFAKKHVEALKADYPDKRFALVDGEAFSWYGSRMLHAASHLRSVATWVGNSEAI